VTIPPKKHHARRSPGRDEPPAPSQVPVCALDAALCHLLPNIPDNARRLLRQPLSRWIVAATKFLNSKQECSDDLRFAAAQLAISEAYPSRRCGWLAAMFWRLRREIDAELSRSPPNCPWRHSCALAHVLEKLQLRTTQS
jgi:hypothetical protein